MQEVTSMWIDKVVYRAGGLRVDMCDVTLYWKHLLEANEEQFHEVPGSQHCRGGGGML